MAPEAPKSRSDKSGSDWLGILKGFHLALLFTIPTLNRATHISIFVVHFPKFVKNMKNVERKSVAELPFIIIKDYTLGILRLSSWLKTIISYGGFLKTGHITPKSSIFIGFSIINPFSRDFSILNQPTPGDSPHDYGNPFASSLFKTMAVPDVLRQLAAETGPMKRPFSWGT